jgi:hypothetical protein
MTKHTIGLVLALFLMAFAGEARAWTPFGTVEHVNRIEDVGLTTPDGDALYLAYKTSTVFFIGGVYLTNDGYVLGLRGSPKHYVDMPPVALLANFQKEGKLPDPLPPYHLSIADYVVGYSLWLVLVPLAVAYLGIVIALRGRRRHRRSVRP